MPFASVVGHRRVTALLSRAIDRGTLPPTLLFAGPSGVGKWRVARATAQTLNCQGPVRAGLPRRSSPESDGAKAGGAGDAGGAGRAGGEESSLSFDACGQCRACDRVARGVHVDVVALEPDDKAAIKIDAVRDVLGQVGYRPFEGKRRVVMIRDADALTGESQAALLKSLEEPPPATMFILTTAVPGLLLPTVQSRCMRLRFGGLTAAEVAGALVRDHEYDPAGARDAAAASNGSIGQALALASTDVTDLRDIAMRLLQQTSARADLAGRLQAAAAVVGAPKQERSRDEIAVILRLAASMLRDVEAINAGADGRVLANPVVAGDLNAIAAAFGGDRARAAFTAVDKALVALERNAGPKVVAEWLATQI